jgi:uncharacterized glyoxalase superfamily protein PhnB
MKKLPEGWPRIAPAVYYQEASKAIDFLCRAFGFEVRLKVEGEGGRIEHSELVLGDGLLMVGSVDAREGTADYRRSPRQTGGFNTQSLCVSVEDADAHCQRARDAGARIVSEPTTRDYGEGYPVFRGYQAEDLEGHRWYFMHQAG